MKVNEGEVPQYYVEGNHEAIISPEVYDLLQRELEHRRSNNGRHSDVHLFSGKIKCGRCGEWYGSKVWHSTDQYRRHIWQCNGKFSNEERCKMSTLDTESIQRLFTQAYNQLICCSDRNNYVAWQSVAFDFWFKC